MPTVYSKLWQPIAAAYGLQALAGCVFVPLQTEKYFDLIGATGHILSAGISLLGTSIYQHIAVGLPLVEYRPPPLQSFAPRQLAITVAFSLWAARLAAFLFGRIRKTGKDSRFEEIRVNPKRFFRLWLIQGTWIMLSGFPVWLTNALSPNATPFWTTSDTAILSFALLSLGVEILADAQKSEWRRQKEQGEHNEKFITRGLWSISRHPNYVAEVIFHASIFALSCRSLVTPGVPQSAVLLSSISPVFSYGILRYLSGVPFLEKAGNKKWGDDPAWKRYTSTTPVFWPWARIYA
ncbi:hypothetical protein FS842_009883 [Serendipita sp. 407]|nr:hypothetical protein FS842_009883 [Serendipita sp. 407]